MFYKIILPLLKPILFTGITINTFWFWNDFLLPQLIISDETLRTIPIAINAFFGQYVMKWDLALPALVTAPETIPSTTYFWKIRNTRIAGMIAITSAGITEVPTTLDEFKEVVQKLEDAGISPISVNGAEWYPNGLFLANIPVASQDDPNKFLEDLNNGTETFRDNQLQNQKQRH